MIDLATYLHISLEIAAFLLKRGTRANWLKGDGGSGRPMVTLCDATNQLLRKRSLIVSIYLDRDERLHCFYEYNTWDTYFEKKSQSMLHLKDNINNTNSL